MVERIVDKALILDTYKGIKRSSVQMKATNNRRCQKLDTIYFVQASINLTMLIKHLRKHCKELRHPCLELIGKGWLNSVLLKSN